MSRTRLPFAIPQLLGFSAPHGALALRWVSRAPSLHTLQVRDEGLSPRLARQLGQALAALHQCDPGGLLPTDASAELARNLAWPSVAWYCTLNPASLQFLAAVQGADGAFAALVSLTDSAQGAHARSIVHGDFRLPNILRRGQQWLFVDWELAGLSDPAVDVGSAMGEVLGSMIAPRSTAERLSLASTRRWLSAFWRGYASRSEAGSAFALRALAWAGEALLRRVYSQAHYESQFDQTSRALIDAALELLIRPGAWRRRLLEARR